MKSHKSHVRYEKFPLMIGLTFLIFSILWFAVYYLYTAPEIINYRQKIETSEKSVVAMQGDYLKGKITGISNNLIYMSQMNLMVDYLNQTDGEASDQLAKLGAELTKLAKVNPSYDQIRIIDAKGYEVVRVNSDGDEVDLVAADQLQYKGDRYYFIETMAMEQGDVYQSKMDLNIENNEIEVPYKPMVRFGMKLYDDEGLTQGILIINYNASEMLALFEELTLNGEGRSVLVDADGRYLAGHETDNFAFMFEGYEGESYQTMFKDQWAEIDKDIHSHKVIQFYDDEGFYSAVEVVLDLGASHGAHWFVIANINVNNAPYSSNASLLEVVFKGVVSSWYNFIPLFLLSIAVSMLICQRRGQLAEIKELAQIDQMTKTFNRDAGLKMVSHQLEYAIKNVMDYSVCFVDLNDLKFVNDSLGHEEGDAYLMKSIEVIRSCFRDSDQLIRMGGDEFLIGLHSSGAVVERNWRMVIDKVTALNESGELPYKMALSHGVASAQEDELWTMEEIIACADERMYEEKRRMKGL